MTIHDVDIYHCQKCGRVLSAEHESEVPECCGEKMAQAVAHISYQDDEQSVGPTETVVRKSHQESAKK